jgi:hypothetical protein
MVTINNDPRPVLRQELSRVFKNQRVIRAFEKIFDLIPPEFIDQQAQNDALNLIAEVASAQANETAAAISRLAAAIEEITSSPATIPLQLNDDLVPRAEMGDIKASTVEAALTDTTPILLASSQPVSDGAGSDTATMTNAPMAGNPTKWVPFNDAGTIRYIPSW